MCICFRSLFVLLSFFNLAIVLSVLLLLAMVIVLFVLLRVTDFDYLFGIFKLFLKGLQGIIHKGAINQE